MDHLKVAVSAIRAHTSAEPRVGIILGTGLGALADEIDAEVVVEYDAIPGFPEPTVESHSGRLIFGTLAGTSVVAMQGRFHHYEGYSLQEVTFPVRVMRLLGVEVLVATAACGGMNPLWSAGELVMLDDHINMLGSNPLMGPNVDELGPRFPDMSEPYDRRLQSLTADAAMELGITLNRGVYVAWTGPALETRAEYRMLRAMGADVVGMSTVPEVIVARHAGMRVLGLSIITDECLPDALEPVDVPRIIETAMNAQPDLTRLVSRVVGQL
jgi:purine-nucleoside phosphorylase